MAYTIKDNLTTTNYTPRGTAPTWIVIHNTANGTSAAGTAYNNTRYFKSAYRGASAHFFVDDGDTVWRCVRPTDTAWHVGDAPSRNGASNGNAIGIEVCERADGTFSEHEVSVLQWLVPQLMQQYGIDAAHICRHHDVTGKACPWGYLDDGTWRKLKARILDGDDIDMAIGEKIWNYLTEKTDASGRGKVANIRDRLAWMAQKQEAMQADITEIKKMLEKMGK